MKFDSLYLPLAVFFCQVHCVLYDPVKHATWNVLDIINMVQHYPQLAITDSDKHKLLKVTEWKPNDPLGEFVPSTAKIICKFDPEPETDDADLILKACHEAGRRVAKVVSIHEDLIILVKLAPTLQNTQILARSAYSASIPLLDIDNEVRFFPQPLVKNMFFKWEYGLLDAPFVEYDGLIRLNPNLKWKNPNEFELRIFSLMHELVHILGFSCKWRSLNMRPLIEEEVLVPDVGFHVVSRGRMIRSLNYNSAYSKFIRFKVQDNWITSLEGARIQSESWGIDSQCWDETRCSTPFPLKLAGNFKDAMMTKGNTALNTNLAHGRDIPLYEKDLSHIDDISADFLMYPVLRRSIATKLPEKYPTGWIGPKIRAILGAMGYGIAGLKGIGVISVQDDMKIIPPHPQLTAPTTESQDDTNEEVSARWYSGSKPEVTENHFTPFNRYHRDHFCLKTIEHGIRKQNEEKAKEKN